MIGFAEEVSGEKFCRFFSFSVGGGRFFEGVVVDFTGLVCRLDGCWRRG